MGESKHKVWLHQYKWWDSFAPFVLVPYPKKKMLGKSKWKLWVNHNKNHVGKIEMKTLWKLKWKFGVRKFKTLGKSRSKPWGEKPQTKVCCSTKKYYVNQKWKLLVNFTENLRVNHNKKFVTQIFFWVNQSENFG